MRKAPGRLSMLLALLLAGCGGSSGAAPSPVGLGLTRETAHFLISYSAADASCIDAVADHLEGNQQRICADLRYGLNFKVVLEIYPDLTTLHKGMNAPNAPDWVIGLTNLAGEIKMISPLNPGPNRTFQIILRCIDHEFTHAVVLRGLGATSLPNWLHEGVASYEAGLIDEAGWAGIEPYVKTNRIPTFSALNTQGQTFVDNGGYVWSYTIIDFAMIEYGRDKLRPWIDNGGSFDSTFGVSEAAFRGRWIEYLKAHYPTPGDTRDAGPEGPDDGRFLDEEVRRPLGGQVVTPPLAPVRVSSSIVSRTARSICSRPHDASVCARGSRSARRVRSGVGCPSNVSPSTTP